MVTTPWSPYDDCVITGMRASVTTPSGSDITINAQIDGFDSAAVITIPAGLLTITKTLAEPVALGPTNRMVFNVSADTDGWGGFTVSAYFKTYAKQYLSGGLNFFVNAGVINN